MAAHRGMVPLAVGIVGPGLIGRTLMQQLKAQAGFGDAKTLLKALYTVLTGEYL